MSKYIGLACFTTFLLLFSETYCQKSKATREETFEWIKGKLVDEQNYPPEVLSAKNSTVSDFSFLYNECTIQYSFLADTKGNEVVRFQKVNLADISTCEITSDSTSIILKPLYNQKIVKNWWVGPSFPAHRTEDAAMLFNTFTIVTPPRYAARLKTAFEHAISLCGGGQKEEKF